jgi:hypothetical protein
MANAMPSTADRGDIIHFAGRHRLSPALRDGAPALVAVGDPGQRVGWAEFFAELRARELVASFDPEDPASFRLVPAGASAQGAAAPAHGPGGRGVLAEARRFLAALRGRFPPA